MGNVLYKAAWIRSGTLILRFSGTIHLWKTHVVFFPIFHLLLLLPKTPSKALAALDAAVVYIPVTISVSPCSSHLLSVLFCVLPK